MNDDVLKKLNNIYQAAKQPTPQNPAFDYQPPSYEETPLKQMADDVKEPIKEQLKSIQSIAESADTLATQSKDIADSAKQYSDIALAKSKKADIKGWISIFIAAFGVFIEFAIHHTQVINYVKSLLGV